VKTIFYTSFYRTFEGGDSYFIVFRKPVSVDAGRSDKMNFPELKEITELSGSWKISFDPKWGGLGPVTFPKLAS